MTISGEQTRVRAVLSRWGRSLREVPRWVWAVAASLSLVVVVVIVTGGLARSATEAAEVGAGDEVRTSTYAITVLDVAFTDAIESEYLEAEPGEKLLVMTARMENLADAPIGVGTTADLLKANLVNTSEPLLDLHGTEATGSATVWRNDGSAGQVILQPGVPDEVTIAWPVPDDAYTDDAVALDVHEAEVSRGAVILSSRVVTWRPDGLVARVLVPVAETR
ncbi:hypothetical protein [Microbacterium hydrocarbonoxydans]|uniref:hypothetical protein n=1 Tax=Microbacterium hydrocarbonoxydans TaxID=273678 RepID=UPI002041572E|nr:hypothetical protein [Microbacterium hydrocarbonoxydans]MCM3779748.1 hypothetical protein [Microbacterium hydrocarbonoxydans]